MRTECKFSESSGKTIEAVKYSFTVCQSVVTFTDGTFATIGAKIDSYDGDAELQDAALALFDFGHEALIELGVISAVELEEKRLERDAAMKRNVEQRDRALYEELRAKFENE